MDVTYDDANPIYRLEGVKEGRGGEREEGSLATFCIILPSPDSCVFPSRWHSSQTTKNSSLLMNGQTERASGAGTQLWLSLKFAKRAGRDGPFCRGRLSGGEVFRWVRTIST